MKKGVKIWLIVAAALVGAGLLLFVSVMAVNRWDFTKLGTGKYETNTYELHEEFSNISIKTDTADIVFAPSEDGVCRVICYEEEKAKHFAIVQDETLSIQVHNTKKWYDHIVISSGSPKITVYLPQNDYVAIKIEESTGKVNIPKDFQFESIDISTSTGAVTNYASATNTVKIKTTTGIIRVENVSVGALDLSVSTGDVTVSGVTCGGEIKIGVSTGKTKLTDVSCKSVTSNGSTGDILLKNVIASERVSIERDTGDVRFEGSDAAEIFVKTDTGDVSGSLLTDKVFITETDTGHIRVPSSVSGGRCEITTDTGDIEISIG